jgi:hypothetical protein
VDEEAGVIIETPPAAAAGSMEIEVVAVVLLFPVFVLVSLPVVSESVAVPVVSESVAVRVFVSVFVSVVLAEVLGAVEESVVDSEVSAVVVSVVSARLSKESPRSAPYGCHGQADDIVPSSKIVQSTLKIKHRMSKVGEMIRGFRNQATEVLLPGLKDHTSFAQPGVTCQKKRSPVSKQAY